MSCVLGEFISEFVGYFGEGKLLPIQHPPSGSAIAPKGMLRLNFIFTHLGYPTSHAQRNVSCRHGGQDDPPRYVEKNNKYLMKEQEPFFDLLLRLPSKLSIMLPSAYLPPPPSRMSSRRTTKKFAKYQLRYDQGFPTVESIDIVKAKPEVSWNLTFEKQEMEDFVRMTNGLDNAMQLGIPIEISFPTTLKRVKSLFSTFKSREPYDPYDPSMKVLLKIDIPKDHGISYSSQNFSDDLTAFGRCTGRTKQAFVRTALDSLARCYLLRDTLVSLTQSVSALGLPPITERIVLSTIFYQPYVNIRKKLAHITNNRGVWIKVGRLQHSPLSQTFHFDDTSCESTCGWVVLAVIPTSLHSALSADSNVSRIVKEPSDPSSDLDSEQCSCPPISPTSTDYEYATSIRTPSVRSSEKHQLYAGAVIFPD